MKDLTWLKENLISHRGLHTFDKSIPENSYAAFKKSMDYGFSIECDLNLLKDGTVVVFHDKDFNRLCGINKNLSDVTYEEMKNYTLEHSRETILTLPELLSLVDGKVPLLIELKPHGDAKRLCEQTAKILDGYAHPFAIFSFHPRVVLWFKKYRNHYIRGQISEYFKTDQNMKKLHKYMMKILFFNRFTKPDFISYGITDLPNKYCDKAKRKGLTVISYAAKTQKQLDFVKSNYHNAVFEYFIPKQKSDS